MTITEWKAALRWSHDPPYILEALETAAADYFNKKYSP
jgi:hypothetical protein